MGRRQLHGEQLAAVLQVPWRKTKIAGLTIFLPNFEAQKYYT
jgi:hypothetical protein